MKKIIILLLTLNFLACSSDSDENIKNVSITFKFTQYWDNNEIESVDINNTEYTNKLGTKLKIERLRYLISDFILVKGNNEEIKLDGYHLVDISNNETLSYKLPETIGEGSYQLKARFGFKDADNTDGTYPDLNTADWDVGTLIGGGYHYMQLDGKFFNKDLEWTNYNFHAVRATNGADPNNPIFQDTSIELNFGNIELKSDATITLRMNVDGWFKSPNEWDLDEKHTMLMPNFEAQQEIAENGESGVFVLQSITQ